MSNIEDDENKKPLGSYPVLGDGGLTIEAFDAVSPYTEPVKAKYYCAILNFAVVDHEFSLQERAEIFVNNPSLENFGQFNANKDMKDNGVSKEGFVATITDYVRNNEMAKESIQFCDTYEKFALFEMIISDDGHEIKELFKDFPEDKFTFSAFPTEDERDNSVNYLCGTYQDMQDHEEVIESLHLDS